MKWKLINRFKNLNWTNYVIELAIVFLGITIAFYINKKAEDEKIKQEEKKYLQMIQVDLINIKKEDSIIINYINKELKDFVKLRDLVKNHKKDKLDTLIHLYIEVSKTQKHHPTIQTYELLVDNGEILKLSNFALRKELAKYYAYRKNLKSLYKDTNGVKKNELSVYLSNNYDFFNKKILHEDAFFKVELLNILYKLRQALLNKGFGYKKLIDMNKDIEF